MLLVEYAYFVPLPDFVVGLQLTHSGRFSRPNDKRLEPRIAYHHPLLEGIEKDSCPAAYSAGRYWRVAERPVVHPHIRHNESAGATTTDRQKLVCRQCRACHAPALQDYLMASPQKVAVCIGGKKGFSL